jgi:hypothetical protein
MEKTGLAIGIIGGIGLGLLLGSEYPGQYSTSLGAAAIVISLASMILLSLKKR